MATSKIGEFTASGFIFKDSVEAVAVEDPDGENLLLSVRLMGSESVFSTLFPEQYVCLQ